MNKRRHLIQRIGAWADGASVDDLRRFIVALSPYVFLVLALWLSQNEFTRTLLSLQFANGRMIQYIMIAYGETLTTAFMMMRGLLLTVFFFAVLVWLHLFLRERTSDRKDSQ